MPENDALNRGFHGIPDKKTLRSMSFIDLAVELGNSEPGSPKHEVIQREIKRIHAKDQAHINRCNVILGGGLGLLGVIIGAVLTWYLSCHLGN